MNGNVLKYTKVFLTSVIGIYAVICALFYFNQEKLIFHPVKLDSSYKFKFTHPFEEINLTTADGVNLNALLFKSDDPKGVVYYLHGNGGCLKGWGLNAGKFLENQYDVFMLDYRGYGKSGDSISSESQFFDDAELAYQELKKRYGEKHIIVLGYSIGTAAASKIAAENNPKNLILKAPYVNIRDLASNNSLFKFVTYLPPQLLKYKFKNDLYLPQVKAPVILFHGADDKLIYPGSSEKLITLLKPTDQLFILPGVRHNNISRDATYRQEIKSILSSG
ncbi:alpha/beta fold hydrolase [uncultured Microbulbifer sp.]|uniref:alpha/beta hydrolase n=1 Tax=uncultured Microbulbifer sp. TaxID=348147 RepID=UPI0026001C9E|nr:alpha/beta fold hydrolase [uncultured Microbulbifer sp.]